jgi:hypothetical protein
VKRIRFRSLRFRSLQGRLAFRLALVFVVATVIAVGILIYRAYDATVSLNDRELSLRASDLAESVSVDGAGSPHLDLPAKLAVAYRDGSESDVFAVRARDGSVIAASPASFGRRVAGWPPATDDPAYFRLEAFGARPDAYYGLSVMVESAAGPLSISVARAAGSDALVHSLLQEFVVDIAWVIPVVLVITLGIGILAIRSGLKPVVRVSQIAASIDPGSMSVRLPDDNLPTEIVPLVGAVTTLWADLNRALPSSVNSLRMPRTNFGHPWPS